MATYHNCEASPDSKSAENRSYPGDYVRSNRTSAANSACMGFRTLFRAGCVPKPGKEMLRKWFGLSTIERRAAPLENYPFSAELARAAQR